MNNVQELVCLKGLHDVVISAKLHSCLLIPVLVFCCYHHHFCFPEPLFYFPADLIAMHIWQHEVKNDNRRLQEQCLLDAFFPISCMMDIEFFPEQHSLCISYRPFILNDQTDLFHSPPTDQQYLDFYKGLGLGGNYIFTEAGLGSAGTSTFRGDFLAMRYLLLSFSMSVKRSATSRSLEDVVRAKEMTSALQPRALACSTRSLKSPSPDTRTTTSSLDARRMMSMAMPTSQSPFFAPPRNTWRSFDLSS